MYPSKRMIGMGLAATCALAGAAQAQVSVTVYGKLYPQITNYSSSDGSAVGTPVSTLVSPVTAQSRGTSGTVMESSNSYIGFRGTEDLGGGLKLSLIHI